GADYHKLDPTGRIQDVTPHRRQTACKCSNPEKSPGALVIGCALRHCSQSITARVNEGLWPITAEIEQEAGFSLDSPWLSHLGLNSTLPLMALMSMKMPNTEYCRTINLSASDVCPKPSGWCSLRRSPHQYHS
ncbi:unnamed protein product, partial [Pleuronectes platessa]